MKKIVLLGSQPQENLVLQYVTNPSKFKVKKMKDLQNAQKLIDKTNPDFVLCTGTIKMNSEGKYFLEI